VLLAKDDQSPPILRVQREREREKAVGWLSMGEGRGELKLETGTEGQSQFRDLLTVSLGAKRGGRGAALAVPVSETLRAIFWPQGEGNWWWR
jgi:hypothetical protein